MFLIVFILQWRLEQQPLWNNSGWWPFHDLPNGKVPALTPFLWPCQLYLPNLTNNYRLCKRNLEILFIPAISTFFCCHFKVLPILQKIMQRNLLARACHSPESKVGYTLIFCEWCFNCICLMVLLQFWAQQTQWPGAARTGALWLRMLKQS